MSDKLKYALILDLKGNFARMTASAQKAMNRFAQTGEAGLKRMAKAMPAVGVDVTATEQAEIVTYATSAITGVSGLVIIGRNLYTKYKAKSA